MIMIVAPMVIMLRTGVMIAIVFRKMLALIMMIFVMNPPYKTPSAVAIDIRRSFVFG